jgi:four helix bundle protein
VGESIKSYRDLQVWQKTFDLGLAVYAATDLFPDREKFGLTVQLRRSGVSVPSNIAEGYGRASTPDYLRFLRIARGSLYELDTQLSFAVRLGCVDAEQHAELQIRLDECGRMLAGLIRSIE